MCSTQLCSGELVAELLERNDDRLVELLLELWVVVERH